MLLEFCDKNEIPYDICGKVIVATCEKEIPGLNNLFERGKQNGLENLKELSSDDLKEYEPYVNGIRGILVPQTGIIDYKIVSERLANLIRDKGAEIYFQEKLEYIDDNKNIPRGSALYTAPKFLTPAHKVVSVITNNYS